MSIYNFLFEIEFHFINGINEKYICIYADIEAFKLTELNSKSRAKQRNSKQEKL